MPLKIKKKKRKEKKGCEQQRLIKIQPWGEDQIEGIPFY